MISFILNQKLILTEAKEGAVLLDFIREKQGLTGTKEACREGECGACTVLCGNMGADGSLKYKAIPSCITPIGAIKDCHIVTIEGVNLPENAGFVGEAPLNLIQELLYAHNGSQCGFCTPGFVLALTNFALNSPNFSYDDALVAMDGNICRCTGYKAIRDAAFALSQRLVEKAKLFASGQKITDISLNQEKKPINTENNCKNISTGQGATIDDLTLDEWATISRNRLEFLIEAEVLPEYFRTIKSHLLSLEDMPKNEEKDQKKPLIAGGTDLYIQKPESLEEEEYLNFIMARPELNYIREGQKGLEIGAAVTIEDFRISHVVQKYYPQMEKYLLLHSSTLLRNRATLAGNIVNASPIGDITIMLLPLDCDLILVIEGQNRTVKLADFHTGYKENILEENEIISGLIIPYPDENYNYRFEKVSNRKKLDIAAVNTAIYFTLDGNKRLENILLSAGGVAPVPKLISEIKGFIGRKIDDELIQELAKTVSESVKPIDDIRGTATYKKLLLRELVKAHFAPQKEAKL